MRVLIVSNLFSPNVLGGYELGCEQISRALAKQGHSVRILTSSFRGHEYKLDDISIFSDLELKPMYFHKLNEALTEREKNLYEFEAYHCNDNNVRCLIEHLEDFEPDVCYFWNMIGIGGNALIGACQLLGINWVMHLMDAVPSILTTWNGRECREFGSAWGNFFKGRFISMSRQLIDEINCRGVLLPTNCAIVPGWINVSEFYDRKHFWSPHTGLPLKIAYAGVVSPSKGADIVASIGKMSNQRGYDVEMSFFGRIESFEIQKSVVENNFKNIRFFGQIDRRTVIDHLHEHDLLLFPTWHREPFGFVALEAAAAGCLPVITNRFGACEELIDRYDCLKVARDQESFMAAVQSILAGDIDLELLSKRAMLNMRRYYDLSVFLPKIEKILMESAVKFQIAYKTENVAEVKNISRYLKTIVFQSVMR